MKYYLPVAVSTLCISLFVLNCTRPTDSDSTQSIKQPYQKLSKSIQLEVETFRGKKFLRPVTTMVYTQAEYAALYGRTSSGPSQSEKNQTNSILRLEGFLHQNASYYEDYDTQMTTSIGGFYEQGTDTINVIIDGSGFLTYDDSTTFFHELVHALQDQYHALWARSDYIHSSDQAFAFRYVVEGEAELLSSYYGYKLYFGAYPWNNSSIVDYFDRAGAYYENMLDSLHIANEPLIVNQPFVWSYYSYGPLFLDYLVGTDWQIIDNIIFPNLPLKTSVILTPSKYPDFNEYFIDLYDLVQFVDSNSSYNNKIYEVDEFGAMLTSVMLREWDFSQYLTISQGLKADRSLIFGPSTSDSLKFIWYTIWDDQIKGQNFFFTYKQLIEKKRNITLPAAILDNGKNIVNDSINNVYIENSGSHVFAMENCTPAEVAFYKDSLRAVNGYTRNLFKQRYAVEKQYPRVEKGKIVKKYMPFKFE
jgi:hypothetical protein